VPNWLSQLIYAYLPACKHLILLRVVLTQTGFSPIGTTAPFCDLFEMELRIIELYQ
jgi:hypothetical protein